MARSQERRFNDEQKWMRHIVTDRMLFYYHWLVVCNTLFSSFNIMHSVRDLLYLQQYQNECVFYDDFYYNTHIGPVSIMHTSVHYGVTLPCLKTDILFRMQSLNSNSECNNVILRQGR